MGYYGTNRYVCSVLDEIRACHKTHNYSIIPSLVEEVQVMVNRMEAAIADASDIKSLKEERSKLKKEVRALEDKVKELKSQCPSEDTK